MDIFRQLAFAKARGNAGGRGCWLQRVAWRSLRRWWIHLSSATRGATPAVRHLPSAG